jgi:protein TonB
MSDKKISRTSFTISVILHALLLILFMMLNLSFEYEPSEYVELSFGVSTEGGSSGSEGNQVEKIEEIAKPEEKTITEEKNKEIKEVDLPIAENTSEENIIKPAENDDDISVETKAIITEPVVSEVVSTGESNEAEGDKKEIDIKLQFTILPDGTIGTIFPKIKADTKLENAAINSLRQWRFEALHKSQKQIEQTAVIIFPYRLQ